METEQETMGKQNVLDKFYTKRRISTACVVRLLELLGNCNLDISDAVFVEPSAGDGSFIDALNVNGISNDNIVAYDIDPERSNIRQVDWLDTKAMTFDNKSIIIIGNPPFGVRSSLAKKFISHSISWNADIVAFILPDTFNRLTNQKCFGTYRLIDVWKLPDNDFVLDGADYHVPCSFFVLTSRNDIRTNVDLRDKKVEQPAEYSFLQRDDTTADFCLNGNSGRVHDISDVTNPKAEHYIKVNKGYDVSAVRAIFENADYDQLSSCNGGNWWINRNDINKAYLRAKEKLAQEDTDADSSIFTIARNMFGDMRSGTDAEHSAYADMLSKISTPLDIDIFSD